jgi:uncharacterized glyoxalase superfamily protein PhnB
MTPALFYKDPERSLEWLEEAFGFRTTMLIKDKDGSLVHSEMRFGDGLIYVGAEWADHTASPRSTGGKITQSTHVRLSEGVDAHCERARAAGAEILREPEDQFYGDRVYTARDIEGHVWTFGQFQKFVSREDAESASGLKIEGWT